VVQNIPRAQELLKNIRSMHTLTLVTCFALLSSPRVRHLTARLLSDDDIKLMIPVDKGTSELCLSLLLLQRTLWLFEADVTAPPKSVVTPHKTSIFLVYLLTVFPWLLQQKCNITNLDTNTSKIIYTSPRFFEENANSILVTFWSPTSCILQQHSWVSPSGSASAHWTDLSFHTYHQPLCTYGLNAC